MALLSQTASDDAVVSCEGACDLHAALEPFYCQKPDRLRYVEIPGVGHMMPPRAWGRVQENLVDWFSQHLRAP
ncbi:hypothetical protein ACFL59_12165 [Planctomycetota bacterium]